MRTHLVTIFVCTDCNQPLELSAKPVRPPEIDDHITGAAKSVSVVAIEPCRSCLTKARKPLQMMAAALALVHPTPESNQAN